MNIYQNDKNQRPNKCILMCSLKKRARTETGTQATTSTLTGPETWAMSRTITGPETWAMSRTITGPETWACHEQGKQLKYRDCADTTKLYVAMNL